MTIKEFTQKCRELQAAYRERMGEPMGVGPWPPENKKSRPQINMLIDGKKTGKNFEYVRMSGDCPLPSQKPRSCLRN